MTSQKTGETKLDSITLTIELVSGIQRIHSVGHKRSGAGQDEGNSQEKIDHF